MTEGSVDGSIVDPLDILAEEFVHRLRDGEHPSLSEYTARHPEVAKRIQTLFPALVEMEQAGSAVGPLAGRGRRAAPVADRVVFFLGYVNVILATFNLLPLPPLDGSAIVERMLPRAWWPGWLKLRQFAMPVYGLMPG